MKSYSKCPPEVHDRVAALVKKFHTHLGPLTIELLFISSDEDGPALKHNGYAAAAVVRSLPQKQRAAGRGDAEILIDEEGYDKMSAEEQDALLDHELYHITPTGKVDPDGRPKLKMKKHDRQFGWFDEIARRHGIHSGEVQQAKRLITEAARDYFSFMDDIPLGKRNAA